MKFRAVNLSNLIVLISFFQFYSCINDDTLLAITPDDNCIENCVSFYGRVTSGNGSAPLRDTEVLLYLDNTETFFGPVISSAKVRTNAKGEYDISIPVDVIEQAMEEGKNEMELKFLKDDQLFLEPAYTILEFPIIDKDSSINIDFFIPQKTTIEVSFILNKALAAGDFIELILVSPYGVAGNNLSRSEYLSGPTSQNSTVHMDLAANQDVRAIKKIWANGIMTTTEEIINVIVSDKNKLEVVYD